METKKCIRCERKIIKKSSESSNYWKTKRFCSVSCSVIGRPSFWKGKKLPFKVWNKGKKLGSSWSWNYGLTKYTDKKVALIGKKSGASRINKPKKSFRIIQGYRWIFFPEHHRACKFTKCVMEQVLIMEKHLGRLLNKNEIVHHINNNKLDNRIKNLRLFPNKPEHMRWHAFNDKNNGLKFGHQIGHKVYKKSRSKISNSLKEWYKHNLHWRTCKLLQLNKLSKYENSPL